MSKLPLSSKVIILHGCPPTEEMMPPKKEKWMNWLEKELKKQNYDAVAPDFPRPWEAKYAEWKKVFEKYPVDYDTLLVGHSCGGAFLVRWLLENDKKVKKLILVAPAKMPEGEDDLRRDLYDFDLPEDSNKIADKIVIFSSNDFPHHLQSLEMYKKVLHPKMITLKNKGHFLYFQTHTNKFPELLEEVLRTN